MDRQAESLRVSEELLTDIETNRIKASDVILKASRLARLSDNEELSEFLGFERSGYTGEESAARWAILAGRESEEEEGKYFFAPLVKIESRMEAARSALSTLQGGGNYSGEWAYALGGEYNRNVDSHALALAKYSSICGQVVSIVYGLVVDVYHELLFSELQATLFSDVQRRIDSEISSSSGSALDKIERISERLRAGDSESVSQGLTTCRRLIDSCADHLFPAREEKFTIGDGVDLKVGAMNVLNRLQAYCFESGISKSRRDRLRQSLAGLYGRCSAGTHSEVTVEEARFVFLQTYIVLGEVLSLKHESAV